MNGRGLAATSKGNLSGLIILIIHVSRDRVDRATDQTNFCRPAARSNPVDDPASTTAMLRVSEGVGAGVDIDRPPLARCTPSSTTALGTSVRTRREETTSVEICKPRRRARPFDRVEFHGSWKGGVSLENVTLRRVDKIRLEDPKLKF